VTYGDDLTFEDRLSAMKSAVARQPVSMAIRSNCDLFSSYSSGIMTTDDDCACDNVTCIDHSVLLVGYDDTTDPPSWKLKNSWGTGWGEDGYFYVSQEGGGVFGLFGMLGEGVIPLQGYNTTTPKPEGSTPDGNPSSLELSGGSGRHCAASTLRWWILLVSVLAFGGLSVL